MDVFVCLTKICQTFSLAPSKLQKRTLAPSRPCPPHMLLGTTSSSRTLWVFMLYSSSLTGFSTLAFRRSFNKSLSLFWWYKGHKYKWVLQFLNRIIVRQQKQFRIGYGLLTRRVFPIERIKSKKGSTPAKWAGEFSCTWNAKQKYHCSVVESVATLWSHWSE